jgi:hypothetical protein
MTLIWKEAVQDQEIRATTISGASILTYPVADV